MRTTLYIIGTLLTLIAIFCLWAGFISTSEDKTTGYGLTAATLASGVAFLIAATKDYKGGFGFLAGGLLLSFSLFCASGAYQFYSVGNKASSIPLLVITLIFLLIGSVLVWFSHRRHRRMQALFDSKLNEQDTEFATNYGNVEETPEGDSGDSLPDQSSKLLYPPMATWRVYLLLLFTWTFYSVILIYRIAKDLADMGEKKLKPMYFAVGMLVPLAGIFIFYAMADNIAKLAKKKGLDLNLDPGASTGFLLLTGLAAALIPKFLYPLSISIVAIPWILLHRKMNRLRLAHTCAWRQPENRYTWRQRSVFVVGAPLMVLILIGSKQELIRLSGERLDRGENVVGHTPVYQLHIPDKNWRKVPRGTLYPGTDLELMGLSTGEWVGVRVNPNSQQTLDATVDMRKSVVAANWKKYKIVEMRTLDSGGPLTPLSLAHYTGKDALNINQSLFVATIVMPENIIEAIGQGTMGRESGVQSLVESLRLTAKGTIR